MSDFLLRYTPRAKLQDRDHIVVRQNSILVLHAIWYPVFLALIFAIICWCA